MSRTSSHDFTLIVPTFNRCRRLGRLLDYYSRKSFRHPILVADSSFPAEAEKNETAIRHARQSHDIQYQRFDSKTPVWCKLMEAVSRVSTEFAAICADDDFLCSDGLEQGLEFLRMHPDYAAAQGSSAGFTYKSLANGSCSSFQIQRAVVPPQLDHENPNERLFRHLSNFFFPIFFAVHRRKLLRDNCQEIVARLDNLRFAELLFSCLTVIQGKVHRLDTLYSVRESHDDNLGQQLQSWDRFVHDEQFSRYYGFFRDVTAEALVAVGDESSDSARTVVDGAFQAFLGSLRLSQVAVLGCRAAPQGLIRKSLINFIKRCEPITERLRDAKAVVRKANAKLRMAYWRHFTGREFRAELLLLEQLVLEHQIPVAQPQRTSAAAPPPVSV